MTTIIAARFIFSKRDSYGLTVGLADAQFETRKYVLLQKSIDSIENDIKTRIDDVYIEINDQNRSAYGGIKKIIVEPLRILILLERDTAEKLMTGDIIEIVIGEETHGMKKAIEGLKYMKLELVILNSVDAIGTSGWK